MFIFVNKNNIDDFSTQLQIFDQNIFIPAFPDPNERESLADDIIPRMTDSVKDGPRTYCILALDDIDGHVIGGLIADWYGDCESLEIIYIAVSQDERRKGIGRSLLDFSINRIKETVHKEDRSIKHIFIEVDIPEQKHADTLSDEVIDSVERISVWEKWGAKRIPINYTQPSLCVGKTPVSHMMLMRLAVSDDDRNNTILSEDLKNFLEAFYKGLHSENNGSLTKMIEDIDMISRDGWITLEDLTESPRSYISDAVITSHYLIKDKIGINLPETCIDFNSYECDLMNYVNQKNRPFKTKFVRLLTDIPLVMPSFYKYTSEGVTHYYKTQAKKLLADISVSISCPPDMDNVNPIAHLSVRPSSDSSFSELDIIRLITPFGSRQENYIPDSDIYFEIKGKLMNREQLLMSLLEIREEGKIVNIEEGASQFDINSIRPYDGQPKFDKELFLKSMVSGDIKADLFSKIICGLILGIFDYDRMNCAEVEDTFRPVVKSNNSAIILSRGHIFKIEDMDEDDSKALKIVSISPYLLIPSTALAFNGIALAECETLITDILNNRFRLNITKVIQQCETVLDLKYLENIFQYQSEQDIVNEGRKQRSMNDRFMKLTHRIDLLKKRAQKSSDIIIEGFLGILATFGIMEVFANEMKWTSVFVLLIAAIFGIEAYRWYKVRKMIDLK